MAETKLPESRQLILISHTLDLTNYNSIIKCGSKPILTEYLTRTMEHPPLVSEGTNGIRFNKIAGNSTSMKIMVGGTFDPLHDGHRLLIQRAFDLATHDGKVVIGLTSDTFANRKVHPIHPYSDRYNDLVNCLNSIEPTVPWEIVELHDQYGSTLEEDFDALVVSEETFPVGKSINQKRRERGKSCVEIHMIRCVLAEDGKWISSTRIWRGEIDVHGKIIQKED